MNTVLASEHYAGREALAQNLLGNAKMSGDEIIAALAVAAKPTPAATIDDDAKDRAEMRGNLADDQPEATADLGNDDTTKADDSLVHGMKSRFPAAK